MFRVKILDYSFILNNHIFTSASFALPKSNKEISEQEKIKNYFLHVLSVHI